MKAKEFIDYIINIPRFASEKKDISLMEAFMELLGNPQKKLKCIHVAGTNGKGSICAMAASILREEGYSVGLYTSPHLIHFNERIQVNGHMILDEELEEMSEKILGACDEVSRMGYGYPTFFEVITACAFIYFADKQVDIVVLETGLGGRLDATNIIENPLVSVITPISLDHIGVLGNTLDAITREKAGIIKKNHPVVLFSVEDSVYNRIKDVSESKNAPLFVLDETLQIHIHERQLMKQIFSIKTPFYSYRNLECGLIGDYQINNVAMVLLIMHVLKDEGYHIEESSIYSGLKNTEWPGRMEVIQYHQRIYVLDGAHNIDGMKRFLESISNHFNTPQTCIVGFNKDKDYLCLLDLIQQSQLFTQIILTPIDSNRSLNPQDIHAEYLKSCIIAKDLNEAHGFALANNHREDVICCIGSLYLIGEIKRKMSEGMW